MQELQDSDPQETREWIEALEAVIEHEGPERAHYILEALIDQSRRSGANLPYSAQLPTSIPFHHTWNRLAPATMSTNTNCGQ